MSKFVFGYHLGSGGTLFTHGLTVIASSKEKIINTAFDKMCIEMEKEDPRKDRSFTYDVFTLEENEEIPAHVLKHFIHGIVLEEHVL